MPRPAGKRCLVIAAEGKTVSRQRNGAVFHAGFSSCLPGGSARSHTSRDAFCILDCIWDAAQETYWVLDLMCWGGHALFNCSAEFRMFWLASKLAEAVGEAALSNAAPEVARSSPGPTEVAVAEDAAAADDMEADGLPPSTTAGFHLRSCGSCLVNSRILH